MRNEVVVEDGWGGRRYAVKSFLPAEIVETWPWQCFQLLDEALEKGAYGLGWGGEVGRWVLKRAEHSLIMDGWVVTLQVWPPDVW